MFSSLKIVFTNDGDTYDDNNDHHHYCYYADNYDDDNGNEPSRTVILFQEIALKLFRQKLWLKEKQKSSFDEPPQQRSSLSRKPCIGRYLREVIVVLLRPD